jgi:hypothetical protein
MKKTLLSLCFFIVAGTSLGQIAPPSAAELERLKTLGSGIGATLRGASPSIVSGELPSNGERATLERTSANSLPAQMEYFKQTTGLAGGAETASGRDGTIGAQASSKTYIDFSCRSGISEKASAGFLFRLGCTGSGTVIRSVKIRMCSALQRGGSCEVNTAYSPALELAAGTFSKIDDVKLGLGCNDTTGACRLTIENSYAMSTTSATADKSLAEKAALNSGDSNTAQSTLVSMRNKKNDDGSNAYEKALANVGTETAKCGVKIGGQLDTGTEVATCDGSAKVNIGLAKAESDPNCAGRGQCVKTATKTTNAARSCTKTIPLTAKVCNYERKTKVCEIAWVRGIVPTGSVEAAPWVESNSCIAAELTGATLLSTKQNECASGLVSGTETVCEKSNRTEYYVFPETAVGSCQGDPYTVGSSCITTPNHVQTRCPSGDWFGRTKSLSQCLSADLTDPAAPSTEVGEDMIAGCGVCTSSQIGYTCYAATPLAWSSPAGKQPPEPADNCETMDHASCTFVGSEQIVADGSGLITSQKENYSCTSQEVSCVEYKKDPQCETLAVSNFGMDPATFRAAANDESANEALGTLAVMNEAMKGGSSTTNKAGAAMLPLLFPGVASSCEQPTGSWGSNGYYLDCCKISLTRPVNAFGKANECNENDARLASSRRSGGAHLVGDWCSKRLPWPLSSCIKVTQGYCAFQGILPRVIQEQGRAQLAALASSTVTAQVRKAPLLFPYYGTTGTWSKAAVANGSSVSAWMWPAYCKDLAAAQKVLSADPLAKQCPVQLINHFAVCDLPEGCGSLPEYPELGSGKWRLSNADPLKQETTALSKYAVVTGSCDPAVSTCTYEVSAWPAGTGGKAVVSKIIGFQVYTGAVKGQLAGSVEGEIASIGNYLVKPESIVVQGTVFPASLPATVRLNISIDQGKSWRTMDIAAKNSAEVGLTGTDATISGGCTIEGNMCRFKITGTAEVTAMPWGTPQNPNCAGFTPSQLSALDFGKMDFSEWITSLTTSVNKDLVATLPASESSKFSQNGSGGQNGGSTTFTAPAPQAFQIGNLTPSEGFGSFSAILKITGYWPSTTGDTTKDTDAVSAVSVDWGDCRAQEQLEFVSAIAGQPGRGFIGKHTYVSPQDIPTACGGGLSKNLIHNVTIKLTTTKSGVQTINHKVLNIFDTKSNKYSSGGGDIITFTPTTTVVIPGKKP